MCSCLQGDQTPRYLSKCLLDRFWCRRYFLFQNDFACFIQNTVERPAVSQIQSNRELVLFENLHPLYRHSANLHCRSPLRLERVVHWERIASRWRPAFSSHLVSRAGSDGRCNTIWYKAVFKGGVYETRETVWAFSGAEERRVASLEGRTDVA